MLKNNDPAGTLVTRDQLESQSQEIVGTGSLNVVIFWFSFD